MMLGYVHDTTKIWRSGILSPEEAEELWNAQA